MHLDCVGTVGHSDITALTHPHLLTGARQRGFDNDGDIDLLVIA